MATIAQILPRRYAGAQWTISGDDYTTLDWQGPGEKPAEATIRAESAAVDAEIAADNLKRRQALAFEGMDSDALLLGFEILIDGFAELQRRWNDLDAKIRGNALTSSLTAFNPTVVNRIQAMRSKIQSARNAT